MADKNYSLQAITKTITTRFDKAMHRIEDDFMSMRKDVDEVIEDVSIKALMRLSKDRKITSDGMWTVASKRSEGSIRKWRRERNDQSASRTGFTLRNNATASHNGYRYPDLIMNKPFISGKDKLADKTKGAGLTEQVWNEFFEEINEELKTKVRKAIRKYSK